MQLVTQGSGGVPGPELQPAMIELGSVVEDSIIKRLLRRKLLFVTVALCVAGVVAGVFVSITPTYKTEATVTVAAPDPILASPTTGQPSTIGDASDLESQMAILSSPMVLREVIDRPDIKAALMQECEMLAPPEWKGRIKAWLHLKPTPSCATQMENTTGLVANLQSRLAVSVTGRSRVLAVAFRSPSPQLAKTLADGVVQAYLDLRMHDKVDPRQKAIEWLRGEIARTETRLHSAESQAEAFLHQQGVVRGQNTSLSSERLSGLAQQLNIAETERDAMAGRLHEAQRQGSTNSTVLGSRTVADIKQQLTTISAQIGQQSARYGSSNPMLRELLDQRRMLEALLSQETSSVNHSIASDYEAANSRVQALRQQVDAMKQEVRGNDDATTQVAALEREAVTDRELFLDLTKNLNQLQTSLRLVTPNSQLVSWAELPQGVFFPKLPIFMLAGGLLSLAAATVAALLRDRSDQTVRTAAKLQWAANLRVLTSIPHARQIGRKSAGLADQIGRPSSFQEAIRTLYAECLLVDSPHNRERPALRSLLVTSANGGEGKSFTTLAFAHFAAAAGKRVLVLECDLRQPSMRHSMGLPLGAGVSEILRDQVTPEQAIRHTQTSGLDIILSGKPVMNSAELLASPRMRALLGWAVNAYDLVVIDTPPSSALPDARILAPLASGIICCAQWGHSLTASVIEGAQNLTAAGGHVLGLVLDRVQPQQYRLYEAKSRAANPYLALHQS